MDAQARRAAIENPILKPLETIECRDAILNGDGTEATWPKVDAIVGNPPFLGDKKMRRELGDEYVDRLRKLYEGSVPAGADLVTYWFEKARRAFDDKQATRAGLVATQAIRSGLNRKVLEQVCAGQQIYSAWSDEPWVNEGAAVRVSLVCWSAKGLLPGDPMLDGLPVPGVPADLSRDSGDGSVMPPPLAENSNQIFRGITRNGRFDLTGDQARALLRLPNPNGRPNSDVLRPLINGMDITKRLSDTWAVDFGVDMLEASAALYEGPFAYVKEHVLPERMQNRREVYKKKWWIFAEARPALRASVKGLRRSICTLMLSKYRFFFFLATSVLPEQRLMVIPHDDDEAFGVLSSRMHEVWSLRWGGIHGDGVEGGRPVYNAEFCFENFPFPPGLAPRLKPEAYTNTHACAIASTAAKLNELRENWLNPTEWVDRIPEIVPGYPDRVLPKSGHEADVKLRTLTNLYNAMPTWLVNAHRDLDMAVAKAYGWDTYTADTTDDEILRRLLALNLERAAK